MTAKKLQPTYLDKEPVWNKITLAPRTSREYTYMLQEHFGKDVWKDAQAISFGSKVAASSTNSDIMNLITDDIESFLGFAKAILDLDDPQNAEAPEFALAELIEGVMSALAYRTNVMNTREAIEATKN